MPKQTLNARGFHVIGSLLVVLFVGLAGFAGWRIFHLRGDSKAEGQSPPAAKITAKKSGPNIPAGWQMFTDSSLGAQFLYPNAFGAFTDRKDILDSFPDYESMLTSEIPQQNPILGVKGGFTLITYKKGHDEITTNSFGPKIKLTDSGWVIAEPNPYNPKNYQAGDAYTDMHSANPNGLQIYWDTSSNQGAVAYSIYFMSNDRLHQLQLPTFDSGAYTSGNIYDQGPYDTMFATVRDSFALFNQ